MNELIVSPDDSALTEEQQKLPRMLIKVPAAIRLAEGTVSCEILNLSLGGAKVKPEKDIGSPQRIVLCLGNAGAYPCRVIWADDGFVGLRFIDPPAKIEGIFNEVLHGDLQADVAERRATIRRTVLWPARIRSTVHEMDCTVLNVSLGGVKVRMVDDTELHGFVTLISEKFGEVAGQVVWQVENNLGIAFVDDPSEMARILGEHLPFVCPSEKD